MRTLVVAPNWIGDAVMAQPLLALLKAHEPKRALDWLAPPHILPVGAAMAQIDRLIEAPQRHGQLQLGARWALARQLRDADYDRAYILPNSAKSALIPWLAGIRERIGYRGESRGVLLTHSPDSVARRVPMVEHYARLASVCGLPAPANIPQPELIVDATRAEVVRAQLQIPPGPLVILAPGAEYGPAKRWPARHFAALADRLTGSWPQVQVVLIGSMNERPIATEITTMSAGPVRNLCGETALGDAFALLADADGVVSNDSGLMHVAAAFGRPQAAVFGSSDPRHTPPGSARAQVLWLKLDCSPCFARECPLGHTACLTQITPETVFDALSQAMARQG
jgi:heptosyltransferase-2